MSPTPRPALRRTSDPAEAEARRRSLAVAKRPEPAGPPVHPEDNARRSRLGVIAFAFAAAGVIVFAVMLAWRHTHAPREPVPAAVAPSASPVAPVTTPLPTGEVFRQPSTPEKATRNATVPAPKPSSDARVRAPAAPARVMPRAVETPEPVASAPPGASPPGAPGTPVVASEATPNVPVPPPAPPVSPPVAEAPPASPAAPAPPAASVAGGGAAAEAVARRAIDDVIGRYKASFDNLDVSAVATVWPGLDPRTLERAFGTVRSQEIAFDSCAIDVLAPLAVARCTGTLRFVPRVGSQMARARRMRWTIELTERNDRWLIERVRASEVR